MESGQEQCNRKKHRSSSQRSPKNATTFYRFASCTPLKLDDVKTRGKKMAKTVTQTHHQTSSLLVGSHLSRSRSVKASLTDPDLTSGQDTEVEPARGSAQSPAKLPKKIDYKSPNVTELTKELVARAKKPKVRLSNDDHLVHRSKPKPIVGIFQRGRQRPTGPVRTFIVFKASSKHNQIKRRKPKRKLIPRLLGERRFSPLPVYNPSFYKKSELKGTKLAKLQLNDKIYIQSAKSEVHGAPGITLPSEVAAEGTKATVSATSHHFAVPASVGAKQRDTKKVAPPAVSVRLENTTKPTCPSGVAYEKKALVGGVHQTKAKSKKKRLSISILQKKPLRRRSRMYKPTKGKTTKKCTHSMSLGAKKPAALILTRRSLLASINPGHDTTLTERIAKMQRLKRLEKDEG